MVIPNKEEFKKELTSLINKFSLENHSNTPDFLLAGYLFDCLILFGVMSKAREKWYAVSLEPGDDTVQAVFPETKPIDMVLHCPNCGTQHVDKPEPENDWTNPPHRSHLCHMCGMVWRPADVPTQGVKKIKTVGKNDGWDVENSPADFS